MKQPTWNNLFAVFGGSFDPPHLGHHHAALDVLRKLHFKKILLLPSGDPPQKIPFTNARHRFEMVKIAFSDLHDKNKAQVLDLEMNTKHKPHYTFHTLLELRKSEPEFAFIIGSDQLKKFHTWHEFPHILKLCHWIILKRNVEIKNLNAEEEALRESIERLLSLNLLQKIGPSTHTPLGTYAIKNSPFCLEIIETQAPHLCSTEIRKEIALQGLSEKVHKSLNMHVIEYLKKHHLYGI